MKIKWTDEKKEVSYIGILDTGKTYDLPDDIADAFVKQGQAKILKEKKRGE